MCVCQWATASLMEVKQHSVNTHNPLRAAWKTPRRLVANRKRALKSINTVKPFGLSVTMLRNNNNNNKLLHVLVIGIVYSYIDGGEK